MFTTLLVFLVSLWAGLMTLSSSAWMNPSVAFAVECVAILAFAAIPVVVLLALIRRLLRFAVDLIHHLLEFAVDLIRHLLGFALGQIYRLLGVALGQIYRLPGVALGQIYHLPGVTLGQIYRLSGIAATLFGRVRAPTSDGCDLSLTSVSAFLSFYPYPRSFPLWRMRLHSKRSVS
mmetsp:Transcript_3484/g.7804  ORF Transcript_3484/g.7804 Transcript_3484/m.7804 type:complete len:176 (+) Transcript_3484:724-1251(+)